MGSCQTPPVEQTMILGSGAALTEERGSSQTKDHSCRYGSVAVSPLQGSVHSTADKTETQRQS